MIRLQCDDRSNYVFVKYIGLLRQIRLTISGWIVVKTESKMALAIIVPLGLRASSLPVAQRKSWMYEAGLMSSESGVP
jgi:hypothetical protein